MQLRQASKRIAGWLDTHLDCIIPIRFSIGNTDKRTTEYKGSMSNQLTVFSS